MKLDKEQREAWLLVAPAALILGAVAVYPIAAAFALSLQRVMVVFHERHFVGLANYVFLAKDARFWTALANTVYFSVVSVTLELVLGLAFALLLAENAPGRGLLRAAVLVPWAIPTVVAARLWAWLFNPTHGLIPRLLPVHDIDFLGTPGWAMHAAILVDVWKSTPFVALLLLAGLQSIPGDLYRAASLDGASRWRSFARITLPLLRPTIALALVFRTLDAFRVFDAVYVLTGGGPANSTHLMATYAYSISMGAGKMGLGSAVALSMVPVLGCLLVLLTVYVRRRD